MFEILPLLHCLSPYISQTTLGQLGVIITALLTMSGRVTMLGIARWAGKGGSYLLSQPQRSLLFQPPPATGYQCLESGNLIATQCPSKGQISSDELGLHDESAGQCFRLLALRLLAAIL